MALPANQQINFEVLVRGSVSALGSSVTKAYSVFHYKRRTTTVAATKAALNTAFQAGPLASLLAAANARYSPTTVSIRCVDDALDPYTDFAAAGAGAIATDMLPTTMSVYMLLRTGIRGRNYQGSKHFGAASEIDTIGDVLSGAGLTRWQALQTALATALVDATPNTWDLCVLSRKLSVLGPTNPTTIVMNAVTQVILDTDVGTMRRRKVATTR